MSESSERDDRHKARMQRKKALIDEKIADGTEEMIDTKMISDMPLPIPRWVMSSPIHMISMAPAVSVPTIMRSKMISGAPAPLKLMPKLLKRKR